MEPTMLNSLRSRLFVFTSLVMTFLMLGTGTLIAQYLESAQMSSMQEQMRLHSHSLLAVTEIQNQKPVLPTHLLDQRFNREGSGLYAQLIDSNLNKEWSSVSAKGLPVLGGEWSPVGEWRYSVATKGEQSLFVARFGVSWGQQGNGQESDWNLVVMQDMAAVIENVQALENRVWFILFITTLVLLAAQALVMRWGLMPLRKVSDDLLALQIGRHVNLEGKYPKELQPLTSNLNRLLDAERGQRERYRNTLSDLSHSLKTPLSVMNGLLNKEQLNLEDKQDIQQQIDRMNQIVKYQLQRSVSSGKVIGSKPIAVAPVIRSIVNAMQKVYRDKTLSISMELDDACIFTGDENDLMELIGNIIDNACKYTHNSVKVTCRVQTVSEDICNWHLYVDDNGPGLKQSELATILKRGVRLDTLADQNPGQGLGLALVKDIVDTYGIRLGLTKSQLGGSCFQLDFNE